MLSPGMLMTFICEYRDNRNNFENSLSGTIKAFIAVRRQQMFKAPPEKLKLGNRTRLLS